MRHYDWKWQEKTRTRKFITPCVIITEGPIHAISDYRHHQNDIILTSRVISELLYIQSLWLHNMPKSYYKKEKYHLSLLWVKAPTILRLSSKNRILAFKTWFHKAILVNSTSNRWSDWCQFDVGLSMDCFEEPSPAWHNIYPYLSSVLTM